MKDRSERGFSGERSSVLDIVTCKSELLLIRDRIVALGFDTVEDKSVESFHTSGELSK